ncbi:DUF2630 family protein [Saccharopolyspora rectivirgula]|jgi:predicted nuclease with TOPRIM domain|uniref:DUF2630 domain-containing protein n=1 Tax=Saccharopolyspora rectivirgula TaxID=28042 RepID=A0A073AW42_9PSEU|nr:DUF2630 family protein [Saccharopolyspora rectivirgula]KEI43561.1 hypothetical protein GU90_14555 [Saccharopolyspora rectivirgula]
MADADILGRIDELIAEEQRLRSTVQEGKLAPDEERQRLRNIEVELDQCWDLLRQRRAQREFGDDPEKTRTRSRSEVENYRQ